MKHVLLFLGLLAGCGDDGGGDAGNDAGTDGATDGGGDSGPPARLEDLPIEREMTLPDLGAPVEAIQDDRGRWHIYGATFEDVARAEGYLQASDRMAQMDFIRRAATGRLAALAGDLFPSLIEDDTNARFEGHLRNAIAIEATLSAEERDLLEAYVAGVNVYIAQLRADDVTLPAAIRSLLPVSAITDWSPLDTLAIARLQSASLSFDLYEDLEFTDSFSLWQTHFAAGDGDPRIARLAGAFHDLYPFRPARDTFVIDGFPNIGADTGSRALRPPPAPRPRPEALALPSRASLDGAVRFAERIERRYEQLFGGETRGSNSWVVSGEHTENGNPLLANDPHLALTSPPLFWQAHVNTERMGGEAIDVVGQMIAGTPVNILGFNQDIAWGLTTHGYDVTDVYRETITPGTGGAPDTVLFEGGQVPIETITEVINVAGIRDVTVEFELVPHHGLIVPGSRTETEALTVRWTGNEPSNEPAAFVGLYRSGNIDEARDAIESFAVGGQTFVVIGKDGDIFYTSQVRLPVRPPSSLTYDPATGVGVAPCFVLPGDGMHEWQGTLSDRFIPHVLNPAAGFIATANADPVGVTEDGNPFDDDHYVGWSFNLGHRAARITERLEELIAAGPVTATQMSELQGEVQSQRGRLYTAELLEELDRGLAELATPGTHPDLSAAATAAAALRTALMDARDRLTAWSFETPDGVEGTPSADEIADSVATAIFNVAFAHLLRLTFFDEFDRLADGTLDGMRRTTTRAERTIHFMLTDPTGLESYDETSGQSVLWDDIGTAEVETRGDRVLRAFAAALTWLADELGPDPDAWRWGRLHTLRLEALLPVAALDIPTADDPTYPDGFPRHGDQAAVDAANYDPFSTEAFSYTGGPQQRLVVEMTPDGPRAWNALPGGNSMDPDSPHQADEIEHWRRNEAPPVAVTEAEVVAAAERRIRFVP